MTKRTNQTKTTLYRRHAGLCPVNGQPNNTAQCECPLWLHGKVRGRFMRKSLDTRTLSTAEARQRDIETRPPDDDDPSVGPRLVGSAPAKGNESLEYAASEFAKAKAKLSTSSCALYKRAVDHFREWAARRDIVMLRAVETSHIAAYFEANKHWKRRTAQGRLTHLCVFFNFCAAGSRQWIAYPPTKDRDLNQRGGKKSKAAAEAPRTPFTPAQITQILAAIEQMPEAERDRTRALVYLLLYSGMRISDAAFAERGSLTAKGNMDYFVIKTGKRIALPPELQAPALEALAKLPESRTYFFQPDREDDYREARLAIRGGDGEFSQLMPGYKPRIEAATKLVVRAIRLAGLKGTCHTFRDTFAISMLSGGADIFTVSKLLGHSDVKITDAHYLKLIPGYREKMSQSTRVLAYQLPQVGLRTQLVAANATTAL